MDWNDPEARLALIEAVGAEEYNRRFEQHKEESTVAVVNGYRIRPVSSRFGTLFLVDGTRSAYSTQRAAEAAARALAPGPIAAPPDQASS